MKKLESWRAWPGFIVAVACLWPGNASPAQQGELMLHAVPIRQFKETLLASVLIGARLETRWPLAVRAELGADGLITVQLGRYEVGERRLVPTITILRRGDPRKGVTDTDRQALLEPKPPPGQAAWMAAAVAVDALLTSRQTGDAGSHFFEISPVGTADGWRVHVNKLPPAGGQHVDYYVSKEYKILKIERGR